MGANALACVAVKRNTSCGSATPPLGDLQSVSGTAPCACRAASEAQCVTQGNINVLHGQRADDSVDDCRPGRRGRGVSWLFGDRSAGRARAPRHPADSFALAAS